MRIPSLDGIRCIAVFFVLISHCKGTIGYTFPGYIDWFFNLGNLGVRIFFVLSGFLITTLLINEHDKYGKISLKKFYMRRTIRIFPAFYFYIFSLSIAQYFGWVNLSIPDFIHSLTYTINYQFGSSWEVGHLWSLAVEEQFYLLWPLTLILLGKRNGIFFAGLVILLIPVVRVFTWHFIPSQHEGIGATFHTVCDALATGCVLAGIKHYWGEVSFFGHKVQGPWVLFLVFSVFLLNYLRGSISISYPVGLTLLNVSIALLIEWATRTENSLTGKLLNSRVFVYLGTLSYSLYLWQQPFLNKKSEFILTNFPLNLLLTFVAAMISYHLIEQPMLNLRHKYSRL